MAESTYAVRTMSTSPLLPPYSPPPSRQASMAAGLSPLLVLLAFTMLVLRLIEADTALATLLALGVWVAVELHRFQRATDRYNADYARRHLDWRAPHLLQAVAADPAQHAPTRAFVQHYLAAGRTVLRDGQVA